MDGVYIIFLLGGVFYSSSSPNAVSDPLDIINIAVNLGKENNGGNYHELGIEGQSKDDNINRNGNEGSDYDNVYKYGYQEKIKNKIEYFLRQYGKKSRYNSKRDRQNYGKKNGYNSRGLPPNSPVIGNYYGNGNGNGNIGNGNGIGNIGNGNGNGNIRNGNGNFNVGDGNGNANKGHNNGNNVTGDNHGNNNSNGKVGDGNGNKGNNNGNNVIGDNIGNNNLGDNNRNNQKVLIKHRMSDFMPTLSTCHTSRKIRVSDEQRRAMENLDVEAVKSDIESLLTDSQEFWPADWGNYGPLFIRLAWHSAGTYRISDGRGGVDGARQRFDPERSWEDNTNLDKARSLLQNIKDKYRDGLSWGDLFILTANVALESMGAPILGFCGGRIDDSDGSESIALGPTPEQIKHFPCKEPMNCQSPLGTQQMELIYVNPEGPKGNPDPVGSAMGIRDIFARMGMNDTETVALIGGGHAFGKVHGACPATPGPAPKEDPENPWPGNCGSGKGVDTYTCGFEFAWTTKPLKWDMEFFQNLLNFSYEKGKGPAEKWEWKAVGDRPQAYTVDLKGKQDIGMLTADVALTHDREYLRLVQRMAKDLASLNYDFKYAWYKLTTRDMGPRSRCIGNDIPPDLPFQFPLPKPLSNLADFNSVKFSIEHLLKNSGGNNVVGLLIRLSWQCSATFRATDYIGGCNGARIRFSPQKDWPVNAGLDVALNILANIKRQYGDGLSWADLIILAGDVALEKSVGLPMQFCPGRTDADGDDNMSELLNKNISSLFKHFNELCSFIDLMNLTNHEYSVLHAGGYAIGQESGIDHGIFGRRGGTQTNGILSNIFFKRIMTETWEKKESNSGTTYVAAGKIFYMTKLDIMFKKISELWPITQAYALDNELFLKDFAAAWTKVNNLGSYDGPFGNMCDKGRFQ